VSDPSTARKGDSSDYGGQVGGESVNVIIWKWRSLSIDEQLEMLEVKARLTQWKWMQLRKKKMA
jgi:hypothetical protein